MDSSAVSVASNCTICLEPVIENVGRSTAKLQCGHVFHLGICVHLVYCSFSDFFSDGWIVLIWFCVFVTQIENGVYSLLLAALVDY